MLKLLTTRRKTTFVHCPSGPVCRFRNYSRMLTRSRLICSPRCLTLIPRNASPATRRWSTHISPSGTTRRTSLSAQMYVIDSVSTSPESVPNSSTEIRLFLRRGGLDRRHEEAHRRGGEPLPSRGPCRRAVEPESTVRFPVSWQHSSFVSYGGVYLLAALPRGYSGCLSQRATISPLPRFTRMCRQMELPPVITMVRRHSRVALIVLPARSSMTPARNLSGSWPGRTLGASKLGGRININTG